MKNNIFIIFAVIFVNAYLFAENTDSLYFAQHYDKHEARIEMRDGAKLYTAIYSPKDQTEKHPIIIWRTPYSCQPYGKQNYFGNRMNTYNHFINEKYIIVIQDVRGRFMSEGNFVDMRAYIPNKNSNKDIDESSDAFDTIDWLVKNVENNNGNVGVWGISYPGFYAAMAAIDAHPNLKAVSPQAPIADWFIADDMHHNGAFTLLMGFNFFDAFGLPRPELINEWPKGIDYPTTDAYTFFTNLGSLKNINKKYYKNNIAFWDSAIVHPNYDSYWQKKNTLPHFKNIKPAVLTVGGWFDGEDLYGAIQTYKSIEEKNKTNNNHFVMGPWPHGGWTRIDGDTFGDLNFGSNTSAYYVENIELPFFDYYLQGKENPNLAEAYIFETGNNVWHKFTNYPPENIGTKNLYINSQNSLTFNLPANSEVNYNEYISDPKKPVPYTAQIINSKRFYYREYMNEDQRFASTRPDVLVYQSEELENDLTIIGPIEAEIYASTNGTDADWVVKVIDVFPDGSETIKENNNQIIMGDYQMLVRGEIMRGRYRNSYEFPEPMISNEITKIKINLNDIFHTFKAGHKVMVQIQSSWFPLFDMNPQTYVDIYNADESDFKIASQKVYFSKEYPSKISFSVLKN